MLIVWAFAADEPSFQATNAATDGAPVAPQLIAIEFGGDLNDAPINGAARTGQLRQLLKRRLQALRVAAVGAVGSNRHSAWSH